MWFALFGQHGRLSILNEHSLVLLLVYEIITSYNIVYYEEVVKEGLEEVIFLSKHVGKKITGCEKFVRM